MKHIRLSMKHGLRQSLSGVLCAALLAGLCLLSACPADKVSDSGAAPGDAALEARPEKETAQEEAVQPLRELKGEKDLSGLKSLRLDLDMAELSVVPAAAGAAALASWTISSAESGNAAGPETLLIRLQPEGAALLIDDEYSGPPGSQRPQLKLSITLPPGSDLELRLGDGSAELHCDGRLSVDIGNGSLRLSGSPSESLLSIGNGSLEGELKLLKGSHQIKLGNGGLRLKLDPASSVSYEAQTSIGQITLQQVSGTVQGEMVSQSASGSLGSGSASLKIESGNGGITLSS
ncbi:hypothetical protein IT575_14620 [bacterium]|nr:hypothetical protein [bacterium]